MSVSDLTGTTWLINDTTTDPANTIDAYINFVSNSVNFVKIRIYDGSEPGTEQCITCTTQDQEPIIFYEHGWTDEAYRTIAITGGEDATNSSLITWLENNATQVVQTGDVIVSYAGADIVTMSDSGTKTLKTQGKYCTDDITIEYTKPSGGGGGSSGLVLNVIHEQGGTTYTLDKTVSEIVEALNSGISPVFISTNDDGSKSYYPLKSVKFKSYPYNLSISCTGYDGIAFSAFGLSSYPSYTDMGSGGDN